MLLGHPGWPYEDRVRIGACFTKLEQAVSEKLGNEARVENSMYWDTRFIFAVRLRMTGMYVTCDDIESRWWQVEGALSKAAI